ncbi:hypothetical protein XENOCAPTIV_018913 [Xenoophorus captivus]|uniref:Uncharacterized protein n=1 Tax=Xenoophorus captivus TaxID=1517983 RepID=A0ABV0QBP1_9TELE
MHTYRFLPNAIKHQKTKKKKTSLLFKLNCDGQPRHVHYNSGDFASSLHCFVIDPRPPSFSSARSTVRLASRHDGPFPSSQLQASGKRLNIYSNFPASAAFLLRSSLHTKASTSHSTPAIPQTSLLRSSHPWILSSTPNQPLLGFSGIRLQLCHISTSSFLFHRRSTRSSAPPTVIHHSNARPGSSLRLRCITSFSFLYGFLIHMPFKHAVFSTPLFHSGRSCTAMHSNISLRLRSKYCRAAH